MLIDRSWFGKQPATPFLWSLKPMSASAGSSTTAMSAGSFTEMR